MPFAAVGAVASIAAPLITSAVSGGPSTSSAAANANATQAQALDYAKGIQQPYLDAGTGALKQQNALLGLSGPDAMTDAMSTFQASPGYQYQMAQGLSAVDNGAAARGMLRSGNVLRAEQALGSNLANQDFNNYYSRLQGLVGTGTGAANALTSAALGTASGQAQTDTSAAAQQANIDAQTGKAIGTGVQNGLNNLSYQQSTGTGLWAGGANDMSFPATNALAYA